VDRVVDIKPKTAGAPPASDSVVLPYHDRRRRRIALTAAGGTEFLLDLPQVTTLRDGDALMLQSGAVIAVEAALEPLLEVSGRDAVHLARLAWHVGNRHLPAQIDDGRLLIAEDHVIADMLRGLGATVRHVRAPFDPEGGAYAEGAGHGHAHSHAAAHAPAQEQGGGG
jgi:urease accessory protein